jgi:hypothetical protein
MATIRAEGQPPRAAVDFLRHCYRFAAEEWQHANRLDLPDQGFESIFRASCATNLVGWEVSEQREMRLGQEVSTASGVLHEIDIVAKHSDCSIIAELKNRQDPPGKNDIVVLFAKIVDYLAINPSILLKEICPVFLTTNAFESRSLAACLGLGIHAVSPGLRPVPLLVDNAKRLAFELSQGLQVSEEIHVRFEDFCAELNGLWLSLSETWISSRFGYRSEDTITVKAAPEPDSQAIVPLFRQLNAECSWLLSSAREAKQ